MDELKCLENYVCDNNLRLITYHCIDTVLETNELRDLEEKEKILKDFLNHWNENEKHERFYPVYRLYGKVDGTDNLISLFCTEQTLPENHECHMRIIGNKLFGVGANEKCHISWEEMVKFMEIQQPDQHNSSTNGNVEEEQLIINSDDKKKMDENPSTVSDDKIENRGKLMKINSMEEEKKKMNKNEMKKQNSKDEQITKMFQKKEKNLRNKRSVHEENGEEEKQKENIFDKNPSKKRKNLPVKTERFTDDNGFDVIRTTKNVTNSEKKKGKSSTMKTENKNCMKENLKKNKKMMGNIQYLFYSIILLIPIIYSSTDGNDKEKKKNYEIELIGNGFHRSLNLIREKGQSISNCSISYRLNFIRLFVDRYELEREDYEIIEPELSHELFDVEKNYFSSTENKFIRLTIRLNSEKRNQVKLPLHSRYPSFFNRFSSYIFPFSLNSVELKMNMGKDFEWLLPIGSFTTSDKGNFLEFNLIIMLNVFYFFIFCLLCLLLKMPLDLRDLIRNEYQSLYESDMRMKTNNSQLLLNIMEQLDELNVKHTASVKKELNDIFYDVLLNQQWNIIYRFYLFYILFIEMKNLHVVIGCGSFNPITYKHLRLFELARDELLERWKNERKSIESFNIHGIISTVHDNYKKKNLISSFHRNKIIELSLNDKMSKKNWIKLNKWESEECNDWTRTLKVLDHFHDSYEKKAQIFLLCGSDVLESMSDGIVWSKDDLTEIFDKYLLICIKRKGSKCLSELLKENDFLKRFSERIIEIEEWVHNDMSSTIVRNAIKENRTIRYLIPDEAIDYIYSNNLYK
ncbi:hypothetical protein SNEBB_005381 [Seison nebaliae]|nr:hypothetical protein SNEBB_005381 [Seison nebaliae]